MKKRLCLCFILINVFIYLNAQNRIYVGLNLGATACFSYYADNNPSNDYIKIQNSYTARYGFPLYLYFSKSLYLETGIRFVPTNIRFVLYTYQGFYNRNVGTIVSEGYNSHQIPIIIGNNFLMKKTQYGSYYFFCKAGALYTSTGNTNFSTGNLYLNDTISGGFNKINWMATAGIGFLLVFNNDHRLSLTLGYSKGFRKIYQIYNGTDKIVATRGSNAELSANYYIPVTAFLPKKWRNKIVSEYMTNKWYKILYLHNSK